MECDLCAEHFDIADRLPKVLVPCGHTACLQCLLRLPDRSCPTCRRDFNGPPPELPTNFAVLQLLEGVRQESTPRGWCSDCHAAATPGCWEDHDALPVRRALRRHLQGALPQAAEGLQGLLDECGDDQALPALILLTGESWDVTLRGGRRRLTATLRNNEEPLTKALWLLLAASTAITEEDRSTARDQSPRDAPPPPSAAPPRAASPPPAAAPSAAALPAAGSPPSGRPPTAVRTLQAMNVTSLSQKIGLDDQKAIALRDAPVVTRLADVECGKDRAWSLQMLERAAATLEELRLVNPYGDHLRAVHDMPRLTRLDVTSVFDTLDERPPLFPALRPGHAGLQWLTVHGIPRATLQSLLRAHARSLEALQLWVGTAGCKEWPYSCGDLHSLLEPCGLRALRRLVLLRGVCSHGEAQCGIQRAQVRRVLPGAEVLCGECDRVVAEGV